MMEWNQKNKPPCEGSDFTALKRTIVQAYKPHEPYHYWFSRQPEKITVFSPELYVIKLFSQKVDVVSLPDPQIHNLAFKQI
jgi:hypothetical protein